MTAYFPLTIARLSHRLKNHKFAILCYCLKLSYHESNFIGIIRPHDWFLENF